METMTVAELLKLSNHKYANLFPMLSEYDKEDGDTRPGPLLTLAEDLLENGCHTAVVLHDGQILDGRNRIAAAKIAGLVELPVTEYLGTAPRKFVLSLNLHRRHLTRAEYILLCLAIWDDVEADAHERKLATLKQSDGDRSGNISGSVQGDTRDLVVAELGNAISGKLLDQGKKVHDEHPDIWKDVVRGAKSISAAYREASGPPTSKINTDAERFEKLFDSAVSRISELIADYTDGGADDIRYVTQNLNGMIKLAERTWA